MHTIVGATLLLSLAAPRDAVAQNPARTRFTFHVYVDPLYGDNVQASLRNPGAPGDSNLTAPAQIGVLGLHPHLDNSGQARIKGFLQHAPYPFRTLTTTPEQGPGALAYVRDRIGRLPLELTFPDRGVDQVVIHCLPGLYGPKTPNAIDADSGLPFNGEAWPARITLDRVSLQGASALDTIFDARGQTTHILELNNDDEDCSGATTPQNMPFDFVDGIMFRNSLPEPSTGSVNAGIWVRGTLCVDEALPVDTCISNCFFQGNGVGIAIDASAVNFGQILTSANHTVRILNNTFAWNVIGLWQGNTGDSIPNQNQYQQFSSVVNNIFDIASPDGFPTALSAFEGVTYTERAVTHQGGTSLVLPGPNPPPGLDFNAFPDARDDADNPLWFNNGAAVGLWQVSAPTISPEIHARVDLTGLSVQPRVLFVADALRHGSNIRSEHDLRLAPNVSLNGDPSGLPSPTRVNPCIDAGIDVIPNHVAPGEVGGPSQSGPLTMATLATVDIDNSGLRGLTSQLPADEAWISSWDFDAEGFGNPRSVQYLTPPHPVPFGWVDLGADECDSLIVAGFLNGTRILTQLPSGPDHQRVFFFGKVGTTQSRPVYNSEFGAYYSWYEHVINPHPAEATTGNFTDTKDWRSRDPSLLGDSSRSLQANGQVNPLTGVIIVDSRGPIPRNLRCDFSPHLLADFHPLWGDPLFGFIPLLGDRIDGYACNPWFDSDPKNNGNSPPTNDPNALTDNSLLYHNKDGSLHDTYWTNPPLPATGVLPTENFVLSGHINPPLTFAQGSTNKTWLLQFFPIAQFGPFSPCSNNSLVFGAYGFNDQPAGCPDFVPALSGYLGLGRRFNLEASVGVEDRRNLQTFLGISPDVLEPLVGPHRHEGLGPTLEAKRRTESHNEN